MNIYDEILNRCATINQTRPKLAQPFDVGKWNFATNGYIAVYIAKDLCNETYSTECGIKKPLAPIEMVDTDREPIELNTKDFQLPNGQPSTWLEECNDCKGSGECECTCGHEHHCGECGGEGELETVLHTWFFGAGFQHQYLDVIFKAADELTDGNFLLFPTVSIKDESPALFSIGQIEFVLMPTTLAKHECANYWEKNQ